MDVMFWTFPHITGKWRVGPDNTLISGMRGEHLIRVRWEGVTPVVTDGAGKEYCGVRWNEFGKVAEAEKSAPDTSIKVEVSGAKKYDHDKPMMDLLFDGCPSALLGAGAVLTYGYKKYGGKHGWKELQDARARYEAAMLRHQIAKATGEEIDPESGLRHSWHIATNALFLAELDTKGKLHATRK